MAGNIAKKVRITVHLDIHHWKAVDLTFHVVLPPPSRVEPVGRQIFGNASAENCIHDLRVRLKPFPFNYSKMRSDNMP